MHLDTLSLQGAANGPVPALRVGAVVAVPGNERGVARTGEGGEAVLGGAAQEDKTRAGRFEPPLEVAEARVEEPEPRMRLAVAREEPVVENEQGGELVRPPAGGRERRVVLDPQIAPEPVNDAHRALLAFGSPAYRESKGSTTTRGCSRSRERVEPTGSDDFTAFVLQSPGLPGR